MAKFSAILCSVILASIFALQHTEASREVPNPRVTTERRDNYQVEVIEGEIPTQIGYLRWNQQRNCTGCVYHDVQGGTTWHSGRGTSSAAISPDNHTLTLSWTAEPGASATYRYLVYKSSAPAALHGIGLASSILLVALLDVFRRISV